MRSDRKIERLSYSVKEAAQALGCSERLLRSQIYAGKIPSFRVGKKILVPADSLKKKLEKTITDSASMATRVAEILDRS